MSGVLCNPSQTQTYILQNYGVYFVRVWIFITTRKNTGHYIAISLVNLGRPVHSALWHALIVVDLNYVLWIVVYFVLHRRDAVLVRICCSGGGQAWLHTIWG
jgi:hypothetical protein